MELGYSITSFYPGDVDAEAAAAAVLERARVAREAGFDSIEVGDHHAVAGGGYLQNVPMAARLAETFDHLAAMFLLPVYDPVLVAEYGGTLDALADRFDLWCAIGGADQVAAMGVPPEERVPRLEESIAILRRLWSDDGVSFDGDYHQVENVSVNPKADARICVGGGVEAAVRRAGRLGDAWVAGPAESPADLERKCDWFADAGGGDLVVRREALLLEDGDRARELVEEKLAAGYRGWPADADWVIAGDADDATAELDRLAALGADSVVVRPMSDTHATETLREIGDAR